MEEPKKKVSEESVFNGFARVSSPPAFWKSRRRAVSAKNLEKPTENSTPEVRSTQEEKEATPEVRNTQEEKEATPEAMQEDSNITPVLSEKRKALFEPLEPITNIIGGRTSADLLLPPPDFDAACYPKGWLIGKKRKLVNVDVVESMRRIAVQEMNRKDREIDGLNEQLEEDARCLEHLQVQLLEERSKRTDVERQNAMLQEQINMLMDMLQENENVEGDDIDDGGAEDP